MADKTYICKTKKPGAFNYEGRSKSVDAGEVFVVKTSSYPSHDDIQKCVPGHINMWMGSYSLKGHHYWEVTEA